MKFMDEHLTLEKRINLSKKPALQEIVVNDGLILRPLMEGDADRLLEILEADGTIRSRVSVASKLYTADDVVKETEDYQQKGDRIRYAVIDHDNLVGLITLSHDPGEHFGELPNPESFGFGYFLDPGARGKGIISAGLAKLMMTVREHFKVSQFVAYCADDNPDSIAVLTRSGFLPTDQADFRTKQGWQERKYVKTI